MRKKTTMGLVIATILTAYISVLTFSNQAFAQILGQEVNPRVTDAVTQTNVKVLGEEA
jgi:Killing trait